MMKTTTILVVDDEKNIVDLVSAYLKKDGFHVITASDGQQALKLANAEHPELVVLDIMLPGMDGYEVLTHIRKEYDPYVIMLTAKTEEIDRVVGLSIGADDYVTKPFSPRELVARVRAALRRLQKNSTPEEPPHTVLTFGSLKIDLDSRKVWLKDEELEFTQTEFDLLTEMAENNGRVLSREQLLQRVWGYDYFGETRVVDVHLGHVRQKIGSEYISTIRGVGYRFEGQQ
ncbi:MAG: response regulator transcription factor [Anaerolineae bacterium]|nr:response regulator transcription factor [Anaerolineae bacterium]